MALPDCAGNEATRNFTATSCGEPVRDRTKELATITIALANIFGLDDWFIIASVVATTPSIFVNVFGTTANGLGRDIWTLSHDDITDTLKFFWAVCVLYFLETALTKLSIICFYIHIFPSAKVRRVLWITFGVTVAWGVAFVVCGIFQCRPISFFWTHWDGLHEGHCVEPNAIAWSNAITNIAFDLWILAIPLSQLRGLQLHWKKKAGVAIMFCLGTFVTVVSILRLQALVYFASTTNITWNFYDTSRWSTVEICLGIVCTCLPTTRLLLVRLFPSLGGTSQRRPSTYHFQDIEADRHGGHKGGVVVAARSSTSERE
ncbi:hypothetical protein ACCO45_012183 [Purpureocillium lilacinum]|uniref:Uncharacterized protein n=1 Tax=Purpureocillium lilacinum TaxID=33203 RepID=A0ACC4DEH1_PURLI